MAFSMRWKLLAATTVTLTLAFGACGDDEKKADPGGGSGDGGGAGGGAGGGLGGGFLDGGLESLLADLDDQESGSACSADSDCQGTNALCALDPANPDFAGSCTGVCTDNEQCGAGGTCIKVADVEGIPGQCAKTCASDGDCESGLQCRKGIDVGDLLGELNAFFDGGLGVQAEETPKICQVKLNTVQLPDGIVGTACTDDTTCGGGNCQTVFNPGGYCSGPCTADSDCGSGGGCARDFITQATNGPGTCLLKCTDNGDCREGYACSESSFLFGEGKYCATEINFDGGIILNDGGANPPPDAGTSSPDAGAETDGG